jgi:hypothetical protein
MRGTLRRDGGGIEGEPESNSHVRDQRKMLHADLSSGGNDGGVERQSPPRADPTNIAAALPNIMRPGSCPCMRIRGTCKDQKPGVQHLPVVGVTVKFERKE